MTLTWGCRVRWHFPAALCSSFKHWYSHYHVSMKEEELVRGVLLRKRVHSTLIQPALAHFHETIGQSTNPSMRLVAIPRWNPFLCAILAFSGIQANCQRRETKFKKIALIQTWLTYASVWPLLNMLISKLVIISRQCEPSSDTRFPPLHLGLALRNSVHFSQFETVVVNSDTRWMAASNKVRLYQIVICHTRLWHTVHYDN